MESFKHNISEMHARLVESDLRWETHASFSMMLTNIILKTCSSSSSTTTDINSLVPFLLHGEGAAAITIDKVVEGKETKVQVQFPGLIGMLKYGESVSAKDHPAETLSLGMSNWASMLFQPDVDASSWMEQGIGVIETTFKEQMQPIAIKFEEVLQFKVGSLFKDLSATGLDMEGKNFDDIFEGVPGSDLEFDPQIKINPKIHMEPPAGARLKNIKIKPNAAALEAIAKSVKAIRAKLKPSAKAMIELVDQVVGCLEPFLTTGLATLDAITALDPASKVMGKLDLVSDVAKGKLDELFSMKLVFSAFATDLTLKSPTDLTPEFPDGVDFKINLSGIDNPSRETIALALDHIISSTKGVGAKFGRFMGALRTLAEGFEGGASELLLAMVKEENATLAATVVKVFDALKSLIKSLDDQKVGDAINEHIEVMI